MRYRHIPLVAVPEAIEIAAIHPDFEHTSEHAEAVYTAALQRFKKKKGVDDRFAEFASLYAVYTAGRLQGIREERQRRKGGR